MAGMAIYAYDESAWADDEWPRSSEPYGPIKAGLVKRRPKPTAEGGEEYLKLLRALQRMDEILNHVDDRVVGGLDALKTDGVVLSFRAKFDGSEKEYSYAAIYVEAADAWFTTGSTCPAKGWPSLEHMFFYYHVEAGEILEINLETDYQCVWYNDQD